MERYQIKKGGHKFQMNRAKDGVIAPVDIQE